MALEAEVIEIQAEIGGQMPAVAQPADATISDLPLVGLALSAAN
jgi:hypothetical protein